MDKITNLDELLKVVPEEVVKVCFMEYMMLIIAKAEKFKQLEEAVCQKNVTMKEIRNILGE